MGHKVFELQPQSFSDPKICASVEASHGTWDKTVLTNRIFN